MNKIDEKIDNIQSDILEIKKKIDNIETLIKKPVYFLLLLIVIFTLLGEKQAAQNLTNAVITLIK